MVKQQQGRIIVMECKRGWTARVFRDGWVIIADENNKLISTHLEGEGEQQRVVEKYKKDGWVVVEEKGGE